jgi:hypothetical protein
MSVSPWSLARAAQVQALAAYFAATVHGLTVRRVSVQEAGAAAFKALGTEIARRHAAAAATSSGRRRHARALLAPTPAAINWVNSTEIKALLAAAAAALPGGSLSSPWGSGRGLHPSTFRLDVSTICGIRWVHDFPQVY